MHRTLQLEVRAIRMTQAWPAGVLESRAIKVVYAGFWRRLAAYVIDGLLLTAVQSVLAAGVLMMAPRDLYVLANLAPVSAAMFWAYFALFESSPMRATVGKYALGLYVSDKHGDPITFRRATARYFLKILSSLTLMAGWFMVAFTPRKQALHDVLAGTLVLRNADVLVPAGGVAGLDDYWDGSRWLSRPSLPEET
jgi:uncharacterized RDD family membrane protein YckC